MASSQISAFVIVLVLAVGARAALNDLGAACTSSDTCVHPTLKLVCDVMTLKCLIQVGQTCNGHGNSGYCVTGAKCNPTSNVCTCDTTGAIYSADSNTGTCSAVADSYGAACGTCTASDNLVCTSTKCTCTNAQFVYATTTGHCVALANEQIGKTCTTVNQVTDCGAAASTFMTCVSLACACNKGYTGVAGGSCTVIAASRIGHVCAVATTTADCGDGANLACDATDLACQCAAGYAGVPGSVCLPAKSTLKGGCAADADCGPGKVCTQETALVPKTCKTSLEAAGTCTDTAGTACGAGLTCDTTCKTLVGAGGDCTSTSTTKCNTGMTCTAIKCVIDAGLTGGSCTVTSPAPAFSIGSCTSTNAVCGATTSGICVCPTGYSGEPASNCAIIAKMFGGTCTTTTVNTKGDCNDVSLVCSATSSGTCGCATGYGGGVNGLTCYADKSLGGGCSGSLVCSDSNAECTTLKCTCKTDYVAWNGKCVLKAGTLSAGASCSGKTCVDGSTCSTTNNKCTCNTGYTESTDGYCRAADNLNGGPCAVTAAKPAPVGTCTDANSNCVNGICKCKVTYIGNLGETCRLSGAGTITLSISLLMLQLAACVWQAFPA